MSALSDEKWPWIEAMIGLRGELLSALDDGDLAFNPGGQNPTLGGLLRELGEIQHAYTESLTTFDTDFGYRNTEGVEGSVARLRAWFEAMDARFKAALEALPADAPAIKRASGNAIPAAMQLDIYLQALFIVFGKLVVYFRAMNKPLPATVVEWIG